MWSSVWFMSKPRLSSNISENGGQIWRWANWSGQSTTQGSSLIIQQVNYVNSNKFDILHDSRIRFLFFFVSWQVVIVLLPATAASLRQNLYPPGPMILPPSSARHPLTWSYLVCCIYWVDSPRPAQQPRPCICLIITECFEKKSMLSRILIKQNYIYIALISNDVL